MIGGTFAVRLGGSRILARVEGDRDLVRRFRAAYRDAKPARGTPRVTLRWSKGRGEVLGRDCTWRRSDDLDVLLAWTEWVVVREAIPAATRRGILLHAAWGTRGSRSALIAGAHGSGKTTLVAALELRHGWRLLADDLVLLTSRGLRPIERPVRIKPGTARLLPEADAGMRSPVPGPRPQPKLILLLESRGGPLRSARLSPGLALAKLAGHSLNFRDDPGRALRSLARLADRVPVHVLAGGGLAARCSAVLRLAGTER